MPGYLGLFLAGQALLLLLQPGRIIALERYAPAAVKLQNPARDIIQEIAVVGYGNYSAGEGGKIAFQPGHGFRVQVICRLVKQKDVGVLQQKPAQSHPAALAAGNPVHGHIAGGTAQGVHGHFQAGFQIPDIVGIHLFLKFGLAVKQGLHFLRVNLGKFPVHLLIFPGDGGQIRKALFHNFPH